jgi:hypothetical protein
MLTEKHIEIASRAALQVFKGDVAKVLEFFAGPNSKPSKKRTFSELSAGDQTAYRKEWETFLAEQFPPDPNSPQYETNREDAATYWGDAELTIGELAQRSFFMLHGATTGFNLADIENAFDQWKWNTDFDQFLAVLVTDKDNTKNYTRDQLSNKANDPKLVDMFKRKVPSYEFPPEVGVVMMTLVGPDPQKVMQITERLKSQFQNLGLVKPPAKKMSRADDADAEETEEQIYARVSTAYATLLQSFAIMLHKDAERTDRQFEIINEGAGVAENPLLFPHFDEWKKFFQTSKDPASEFFKTGDLPPFRDQEIMFKSLEGDDKNYTEAIEHAIWEWEFIPQIRRKILSAITGNPDAQGSEYYTHGPVNMIAKGVVIAHLARYPEMKDLEEFDDTREDTMSMWEAEKYLFLLRREIGKDDDEVVRHVMAAIDAGPPPDMTIEKFIKYVISFDDKNKRVSQSRRAELPSHEEMERVYRALRGNLESFKTAVNHAYYVLKANGWLRQNTVIYSTPVGPRHVSEESLILRELTGYGQLMPSTSASPEIDPIAEGAIYACISKNAQWKDGANGPSPPPIPRLTALREQKKMQHSQSMTEAQLAAQLVAIVQRLNPEVARALLSGYGYSSNAIETAINVADNTYIVEMTEASQAIVDQALEDMASQSGPDNPSGESSEESGSESERELLKSKAPRQVPLTNTQKHEAELARRRERDRKKREENRAREEQALIAKKDKKSKHSKNDKSSKKEKSSKKNKKDKSSKKTKRSSSGPAKQPKKNYNVTTNDLIAFMVMLGDEIPDNTAVPQKIAQALKLPVAEVADTTRIRKARAAARKLKGADIVLPTPELQERFYSAIHQLSNEGDYERYLELSIKKKYPEAAWLPVYKDVTGKDFNGRSGMFGDSGSYFGDGEEPGEDALAQNVINAHFEQTSGRHSGEGGDWISPASLQQQQQQQQQRPKFGTTRAENPYYPYALMFLHELSVVGTTRDAIFNAVKSGLAGTDVVAKTLTSVTFAEYRKYVVADLNSGTINFPPFEYQTRVYNALRGHALDDTTIYRAKIVQAVKQYELVEAGREDILKQIMGDDVEIVQSETSGDAGDEGRDIVAYTIVGLHLAKAFPTVHGPTFVALVKELTQEKPRAVAPRSRPSAARDVVALTGSDPGTTTAEAADKFTQKFAYMLKPMDTIDQKFVPAIANMMREKKLKIGGGIFTLARLKSLIADLPDEFTDMPEFEDQKDFYHRLMDTENYEELFVKKLNSFEESAQEKKEIFELTGQSSEGHAFQDVPVDIDMEDDIVESAVIGYYTAYMRSKETD